MKPPANNYCPHCWRDLCLPGTTVFVAMPVRERRRLQKLAARGSDASFYVALERLLHVPVSTLKYWIYGQRKLPRWRYRQLRAVFELGLVDG